MENDSKPSKETSIEVKFIKLVDRFIKQFLKCYGLRALLGLVKYLFLQKGFKSPSFSKIIQILFNTSNIRTGLFISIMPLVFDLINLFLNKKNSTTITFLSGFISSLAGIVISENNSFMTFIILSVLVRSLYCLAQTILNKHGFKSSTRFGAYSVFFLACLGFLFIAYYHPTYGPIGDLFMSYACPVGNELAELQAIRRGVNLIPFIDFAS
jgi:hypothetical protein